MIELGKRQELSIVKLLDFGAYLGTEEERVLLPKKEVPESAQIGDKLDVFIYRDSQDRLIATTRDPKAHLGVMSMLTVKEVTRIGAFLDWGLEKDLFLPYKEQLYSVHEGEEIPVVLYIDKSQRLAATMHVYNYLSADAPYHKDDNVRGTVIQINEEMGVFLAVENKYFGMIPKKEVVRKYKIGDRVTGRVMEVRRDGKLTISARQKSYVQIGDDSDVILKILKAAEGHKLPYGDKTDAKTIRETFGMSKGEFKRAIGHLYKKQKIVISDEGIRLV